MTHAPSSAPPSTDLQATQKLAWLNQVIPPETSREALGRLLETVRLSSEALEHGQLITAQNLLEDSMIQALIAMYAFDINPDQAIARSLKRMKRGEEPGNAFHIFSDRVEIRVNGDVRGGWPLYSQNDYDAALSLARDLDCEVIHEEAYQLGLFNSLNNSVDAPSAPVVMLSAV